jgi:hypothetical protein
MYIQLPHQNISWRIVVIRSFLSFTEPAVVLRKWQQWRLAESGHLAQLPLSHMHIYTYIKRETHTQRQRETDR